MTFVLGGLSSLHAFADGDLEALQAIALERRSRVRSIQLSFDQVQEAAPGTVSLPSVQAIQRTVLLDLVTDRYSIDRTITLANGEEPLPTRFAYDGEAESLFVENSMAGAVHSAPVAAGLMERGPLSATLMNAPEPGGVGLDDVSLESFLDHGVLRDGGEDIGGHFCFVVDAMLDGVCYATLWLDPERDLLPVRRVTYGPDGSTVAEALVHDALWVEDEVGVGVWIPAHWETRIRAAGDWHRSSFTVERESVVLNPPVENGDFHIDFPPGTIVANRVLGVTYTIDESGNAIDVIEVGPDGNVIAAPQGELPATHSDAANGSAPPQKLPDAAIPSAPSARNILAEAVTTRTSSPVSVRPESIAVEAPGDSRTPPAARQSRSALIAYWPVWALLSLVLATAVAWLAILRPRSNNS